MVWFDPDCVKSSSWLLKRKASRKRDEKSWSLSPRVFFDGSTRDFWSQVFAQYVNVREGSSDLTPLKLKSVFMNGESCPPTSI